MANPPAGSGGMFGGGAGGMSRFFTIFMFILAVFVLFDPVLRDALGNIVGMALGPLIGFGGNYPTLTLMLAGMVMTGLTVVVRHFFTDYVQQAESQKIVGAFNKELRQARLENNTFKTKKLLEMQPKIMEKSMKMTGSQLKLMPVTLLIVVPIFAWVAVFMFQITSPLVAVPWSYNVDLNALNLFPNWVLLYSLISIPFSQILSRLLRYYDFRKRLNVLAAGNP
ncbi:MAG: EMC3/TMCO1 family protein [Methanomassiliicoccales archaeon]|nr:EMC3/TMCO1 family protein [Methanomassiliicoccales archaeon]